MVLTVMPSLPSSFAIVRPSCRIAALLEEYVDEPGAAMSAMTEPMITMRPPPPCANIVRAAT